MFGRIAVVSVAALGAVGCSGTYVNKLQYDRDVNALKEYTQTLERRNAELEAKAKAFENIEDLQLVARTQDEIYQQVADSLKAAMEALRHDGETMTFDPKRGVWTAGTDLLFDSGSWTISAKGQEILKKFAEAHRGKTIRFRVVGHTDRAPIARESTKKALDTDTNMELSARRAVAVMGQLVKFGLGENQFVECIGMGNQRPVAQNDRSAGNMKKNRRVEIFVLK